MKSKDNARLVRTIVQLRPAQIGHRIRLRAYRTALERQLPLAQRWLLAGPSFDSEVRWPLDFKPLDAQIWKACQGSVRLAQGELTLLGVTRELAPTQPGDMPRWKYADWKMCAAPLLWRFHMYYWDWAWTLAAERSSASRSLFTTIWESWNAAIAPGRGIAWQPYPTALRAWSFCGIYYFLVENGPIEGAFRESLSVHAGFLRRNLETDVGGNHLIKNLKALAGLAVFFGDDALLIRTLRRLSRQLELQVLPDGGHYERAPAYHCQVLADLIDIGDLLRAAGCGAPLGLAETVDAMRGWLGAVLSPAGDVPLLNDGFPVNRELLALTAPADPPVGPLHVLPHTGLIRALAGPWHVLIDVGLPCPPELPAHAHADSLSCVVHLGGAPLLIDTGTSTYAAGPDRDRERSTAAHNTVEVDWCDSTEVWGAFRAGRRARVTDVSAQAGAQSVTIEAAHDGYRHLPGRPMHRRRLTVCAAELRVDDEVAGQGRHHVTVRWHLAPGTSLRLVGDSAVVSTAAGEVRASVTASCKPVVQTATAHVGTGFTATVPVPVLVCTLNSELPVRISTIWRRAEPLQETW